MEFIKLDKTDREEFHFVSRLSVIFSETVFIPRIGYNFIIDRESGSLYIVITDDGQVIYQTQENLENLEKFSEFIWQNLAGKNFDAAVKFLKSIGFKDAGY